MSRRRYEMAIYLPGEDCAWWVDRPAAAGSSCRAFRFRRYTEAARWATHRVTEGPDGQPRCDCGSRARCKHVRALVALRLVAAPAAWGAVS